ncbi:MAG: hypothetical protein IKR69_07355 [Bacteroidales bacterium]|nr:hypothetical protein [Bacteroidales bacterium]
MNTCHEKSITHPADVSLHHLISKYTGNSLYLPLWGYIDKQGETVEYNQEGYYLTSDENGEDEVYVLHASNQPGTKQSLITMDKSLINQNFVAESATKQFFK